MPTYDDKKLISLIDARNFFGSDLDRSRTTVLEMVKCGANLVLDRKVDFSQKLCTAPDGRFDPKTFICAFGSCPPSLQNTSSYGNQLESKQTAAA